MADEQLSGRELDAEIAKRVMGWQKKVATDAIFEGQEGWITDPKAGAFTPFAFWRPSESIADAMQVEDRIADLDRKNDYIAALWDVIGADRSVNFWTSDNFVAFWLCVHATAEQRGRAALAAIGSKAESE